MARRTDQSSIVARILLAKALEVLEERHPPHIAWEMLVRGLAAGDVPYWPHDPDLAALWRKLSGAGEPHISHPHVDREGSWVEFHIKGIRRTIYPIQVGLEAVWGLLPKDARVSAPSEEQEQSRRIKPEAWLLNEIRRLKKDGEISDTISKKELAKDFLGPNMRHAVKTNPSVRLKPLKWTSIVNMLRDKPGLWPISAIE